ncbi:MAG: o-succinylbenzoate synthase, partial [Muribaculaceae bacterium]|nr:o-succinylbenzoate synthase [Muribaculaceae bacterium]
IWMNPVEAMERQIADKLSQGYKCLKLKIGANNFDNELKLLSEIRNIFSKEVLELRLDANGCFTEQNVYNSLEKLARFDVHSIEQPLPRNSSGMKDVIKHSPIDIALDEDMIERWWDETRMTDWLGDLNPSYIIIKPSLVGGFDMADKWIGVASALGIGWWATSALESNIGLNAIAQWLASRNDAWDIRHGLGTGQIYTNNFVSPIYLEGEKLGYSQTTKWQDL